MTIYEIADFILLSVNDGARGISHPVYVYSTDQQKNVDLGIPADIIKEANNLLLRDGYMESVNGSVEHIRISARGKVFKANGGYKVLHEAGIRAEDRELQKLVSQSVLDTNDSVKKTNESINTYTRWQFYISMASLVFAIIAVIVSAMAYLKKSPDKYRLRYQEPAPVTQPTSKKQSYMQEAWIYEDLMESE